MALSILTFKPNAILMHQRSRSITPTILKIYKINLVVLQTEYTKLFDVISLDSAAMQLFRCVTLFFPDTVHIGWFDSVEHGRVSSRRSGLILYAGWCRSQLLNAACRRVVWRSDGRPHGSCPGNRPSNVRPSGDRFVLSPPPPPRGRKLPGRRTGADDLTAVVWRRLHAESRAVSATAKYRARRSRSGRRRERRRGWLVAAGNVWRVSGGAAVPGRPVSARLRREC